MITRALLIRNEFVKMVRTIIEVDVKRKPGEDPEGHFHNRFHPDIPASAQIKPGEIVKVECYDWGAGQIKNDDGMEDVHQADFSVTHYLSGPIAVEGAEPGDILEVELLDIQPHPQWPYGHTCLMPEEGGGAGFLEDIFKKPAKVIWDFEGIYATSRHIPGVRFVGLIHTGVVATAPSKELLDTWNKREAALVKEGATSKTLGGCGSCSGPLALLPDPKGALLGLLEKCPEVAEKVRREAARTIPPRENGGNVDIKNLSRGSKIWLPVYVPGANLSVGDVHFSEGDGEITLTGAIETFGVVTLKTKVIKNGMSLYEMKRAPIYLPGPVEPRYTKYLTFEGLSVDEQGKQGYIDATLSFRQALLSAIDYLTKFGYTREQAYMLLSAAPIESRIACVVDFPNACCTVGIPTEIFDFDILPKEGGPKVEVKGGHPPFNAP